MTARILLIALLLTGLAAARADADGIDKRMVGTYRHTYTYTSGSFTGIHEQYLTLRADGTCEIAAKAAASDANNSFGPGKRATVTNRGTWSVEGKTMTLTWQRGRPERLPCVFGNTGGGWKLMLGAPGSRKLWTKIR